MITFAKFSLESKRMLLSSTPRKDVKYSGNGFCTRGWSGFFYVIFLRQLRQIFKNKIVLLFNHLRNDAIKPQVLLIASPKFITFFADWETVALETVVKAVQRTSWSILTPDPGAAQIQTALTGTWSPLWPKQTASVASACLYEETVRPAARALENYPKPVNNAIKPTYFFTAMYLV